VRYPDNCPFVILPLAGGGYRGCRGKKAKKLKISLTILCKTITTGASQALNQQRTNKSMNMKKLLLLSAMSLFFFAITQSASAQIDAIVNGGFETGNFNGWTIDGNSNTPVVNTVNPHSGTYSAAAGLFGPFPSPEPTGDSSFFQLFTVPTGGTLSFWHWDYTTDTITFDWQDAYIINSSGVILQTIFHQCNNTGTWLNTTVSLAAYIGQTVGVKFLVHQDGFGDDTGMYVDDVSVVPEPGVASLSLLGFGALAATGIVRRVRRSAA
jgi:hypothetical protein